MEEPEGMMENPNSWNEVQKLIARTMSDHDAAMASSMAAIYGEYDYSIYTKIYLALKDAGYLKEDSK